MPVVDHLAHVALDGAAAARLGVAPGPLTLRRGWPRGFELVALEYRAADGALVTGWWEPGRSDRPALQPYGVDRRLPGLRDALRESAATLISHRAGKRAVVRVSGAFVKVVRPDRAAGIADAARRAAALVATPRVLGCDPARGLVRFAPAAGASLRDAPTPAALAAAGQALRALHDGARPSAAVHDAAAEAAVVRRWVGAFVGHGAWHPAAGEALAQLPRVLSGLLRAPGTPLVALHRDLHDGQVLVSAHGAVTLLDLDTLAIGEAALDLANLLVHVELTRPGAGEELLDAYDPPPAVRDRLDAYAAATRLRLACVHAFRPGTEPLVRELLDAVQGPRTSPRLTA